MADRRRPRRSAGPRGSHRALVIGASVVGLIIVGEFVAISAQHAPRPPLRSAVLRSVLPPGSSAVPSLTWTNARGGAVGGPLDLTGKRPIIAAGCEGGGAIAIAVSGTTTITLDCSALHTTGPIELDRHLSGSGRAVDVEASAGDPRYIVELLASG